MANLCKTLICAFLFCVAFLPLLASAECAPESGDDGGGSAGNRAQALKYKIVAVVSILIAGMLGVCFPILGGKIPSFRPESNLFFLVKSFAAGVILATGFVHILPDAEENLTSPCLGEEPPWGDFPMTGLVAMISAILTMMIDSFATGYFKRSHIDKDMLPVTSTCSGKEEIQNKGHEGHVHVHTHSTHGHSHGSAFVSEEDDNIRHKIASQVLELGILVHSVIIGLSLGASQSLSTIKPLMAALTFHQLFEGLGLGGCISQARFKTGAITIMVIFFSLTTPVGIGVGIGVSETYNENSKRALMVSGFLNSMAAGILIYMALVDLLAADFMNPRVQSNLKMLFSCSVSLLLGAGFMSLLAIWA